VVTAATNAPVLKISRKLSIANHAKAAVSTMRNQMGAMKTLIKTRSKRGFASMDPERRHQYAVEGGIEVQARGTGHRWRTKAELREARAMRGKKGAR
jgi:hypothetical protein